MPKWASTSVIKSVGIRLFRRVDLLDDYTFLNTERAELRRIAKQRRRCTLVGHMWEVESYDRPNGIFQLKCVRCFPHIDSRQVIISYAPFTTVERKTE